MSLVGEGSVASSRCGGAAFEERRVTPGHDEPLAAEEVVQGPVEDQLQVVVPGEFPHGRSGTTVDAQPGV